MQTGTIEPKRSCREAVFNRRKNLLCVLLGVLSLCLFLFLPLVSKTNQVFDINIPIAGWRALSLFFTGFRFRSSVAEIGALETQVPVSVCVLLLLCLLVMLASLGVSLYGTIKGAYRSWFQCFPLFDAVFLTIVWIVLLSGVNIPATDFSDNIVLFYRTYSVNIALLLGALVFLLQFMICRGITEEKLKRLKSYASIYALVVIPLVLIFVFCLYPILLQIIMAFKEYTFAGGVWNSEWIGLKNFRLIFKNQDMLYIIWNTIYISFLKIVISIVFPLLLAIVIYDLPLKRYKKLVQTIIFIPHFFSWVVIYGIAYVFFNPSGMINSVILANGGKALSFLEMKEWFVPIQMITFAWKEVGWNTIIYFAALSGVDTSMYDAAKVDGAGPLKRLLHITIPSIMPTLIFMTILSLGNILKSAGGEQMLLFYNYAVMDKATVIDTWLYYRGMIDLEYGLGSAMSFFQSAIGILLVIFCNWLSKRTTDRTIW